MSPNRRRWSPFLSFLLLAAAGLTACKADRPPPYRGDGRAIAEGPAREIVVAPEGNAIAWLAEPYQAKEKGIAAPDHIYVGTATFSAGGPPVRLGGGVATVPGAFFFAPDGSFVGALADWSFPAQSGQLVVGDVATGETRAVAKGVSFFAFSPDARWLAYVANGKLLLEPAEGGEAPRELATEVATCEFSPDGRSLLARKRHLGGGQLLQIRLGDELPPRVLGAKVAEYRWAPDSQRIAFTAQSAEGGYELHLAQAGGGSERVGLGVSTFAFSPDGKHLAFSGGASQQKQFGDLFLLPRGAKAAIPIGKNAMEFAFAPTSGRIAWLDAYNAQSRGGTLSWADVGPAAKAQKIGADVPSFVWAPDGGALAFVQRVHHPIFSIDLFYASLGGEAEPQGVAKGVFGYSFSKGGEQLYYRTECTRNGRSCTLEALDTKAPEQPGKKLAGAIYTYHPDPSGAWMLLTYMRMDADALDLAVIPSDGSEAPRMIDRMVLPGTQLVGKPAGVAYAVIESNRLGVYHYEPPAR